MLRRALREGIEKVGRAVGVGQVLARVGGRPRAARVQIGGVVGEVAPGVTILEACGALGVELEHCCGGTATCGTCRVTVTQGMDQLSAIVHKEEAMLDAVREGPGDRLGCQARILGPVVLSIPDDWRGV